VIVVKMKYREAPILREKSKLPLSSANTLIRAIPLGLVSIRFPVDYYGT